MGGCINKPWRYDSISEPRFLKMADTGDLLLFKANNSSAAFTRAITNGAFDHVAIILKFEGENEIYFVDATAQNGVALNKWTDITKYYGPGLFYQSVVYRHVNFHRSESVLGDLEMFFRSSIGLDYGLEASKIIRKNTISNRGQQVELVHQARTFFCSELVAKAFKVAGVLQDDDTACSRFMPSSFSAKG